MITIKKPGLLTSIQDIGRYGYQKYGVIVSGVMDPVAHRIANLLVGNEENAPTLEITLLGPVLEIHEDTLISICGGDMSPHINGKPVPMWRTVYVKKGSELRFGTAKAGCRVNLAVAGGFSVPTVMGSKSTYLNAGIGGFNGRALKTGDHISVNQPSPLSSKIILQMKKQAGSRSFLEMEWSVASKFIPSFKTDQTIRVMKGRQYSLFTNQSQKDFFSKTFEVSTQSDRMGYRLKGETLALKEPKEMLSEAVSFGTIQVPSDGNPIILLADRQTTGGYPKIGQVATVDLPLLAQAKPGDRLRFSEIEHEVAEQLLMERERKIQELKKGILLKFKREA
ncbi:KipI antagonist [Heyndrickxia shackletonii]|uniref:KipI antagonist n=1 Tax=Heyndrickxia shackletonii TaxID=157838 RepID=A0A0Q3TKX0_9BACI|nr:biotin-dependent carboxyltransferase family protein [Heyndrickxia shackletonii]KQL54257.1 KipI antagonist [Heyndrickxia shackletonii]NEZ00945.1 biotin-dependent carboxyltransferase [Heyndrickxia shackletonii]